MLTNKEEPKYNLIVDGQIVRYGVTKRVAESYILTLKENSQHSIKMVPVTSDGKEILLG